MKYENFNEFFSNLETDNNQIDSKWQELRKKKKRKN